VDFCLAVFLGFALAAEACFGRLALVCGSRRLAQGTAVVVASGVEAIEGAT
jgi:hypothetical protein